MLKPPFKPFGYMVSEVEIHKKDGTYIRLSLEDWNSENAGICDAIEAEIQKKA